jgi:N-acetyl-gamma-glutamyl-phosphate/LysW-gamma-L-alpha-aminoadipyl-6-phosphate reductase
VASSRIRVAIEGGSGYVGGELLRLLLFHPAVEVTQVTSESQAGEPVGRVHPVLRRRSELVFCRSEELEPCDTLFACLPHGEAMHRIGRFRELAPRVVDLSADFRLRDPAVHERWYGAPHAAPELLGEAVYGLAELHRDELRTAHLVACGGCNATAVILALFPLYRGGVVDPGRTVVEVKTGTSEGGHHPSPGSHHPDRSGSIRCYRPTTHRHTAEMHQELELADGAHIHFTATAVDMVRGIHCVAHVFLNDDLDERGVWRIYRDAYGDEPFVRIVNERRGVHRLPDPRLVTGTNFCDIGFARDTASDRLVVLSAIDNLVRGAAGQAVQAFNLMHGLDETTGLEFPGLYPL